MAINVGLAVAVGGVEVARTAGEGTLVVAETGVATVAVAVRT
jgi:hypothetical protein